MQKWGIKTFRALALLSVFWTSAAALALEFWSAHAALIPLRVFIGHGSRCEVRQFDGAHTSYKIFKNHREMRSLDCDCSITVLFSPSGKYIAFGNSQRDAFGRKFGMAVYNCDTGSLSTYVPVECSKKSVDGGCTMNSTTPVKWAEDETYLEFLWRKDGRGTREGVLKFTRKEPLP